MKSHPSRAWMGTRFCFFLVLHRRCRPAGNETSRIKARALKALKGAIGIQGPEEVAEKPKTRSESVNRSVSPGLKSLDSIGLTRGINPPPPSAASEGP